MGPSLNAIVCVLAVALLLFSITYLFPSKILRAVSRFFPEVTFFVPQPQSAPKLVALSIDDTCDPVITLKALEVLARYKAKATFFVIGSHVVEADAQAGSKGLGAHILQQVLASGHELGNHTWFDRPTVKLSIPTLRDELVRVQDLIDAAHEATGVPSPAVRWFRPGHGWFSRAMLNLVQGMGYKTALGDVFPYDPQVSCVPLNAWMVEHNVRTGSIIILHDCRPWLIPTLEAVLPYLINNGYSVVTLSSLIGCGRSIGKGEG